MVEVYRKPCFDSSFFIGGLNEEICNGIKRGLVFRWLWNEAKEGRFEKLYISAMTLAEVYKSKKRRGEPTIATPTECLDEFLELIEEEFVEVIEIDRTIALHAHALCRKYNFYPGDGLQLACAIQAQCDVFFAWDRPLLKPVTEVHIEEPLIYRRDLLTPFGYENATEEEIKEYDERNKPKAPVIVTAGISGSGNGAIKGEATATPAEATTKPPVAAEIAQDTQQKESGDG